MTSEIAALRARVEELAATIDLISSSPALQDFITHRLRIAQIRQDADTITALVSGSPEERATVINGTPPARIKSLVERVQHTDLVEICRGLDHRVLAKLMAPCDIHTRRLVIAGCMPASVLPDLVRVSQPRSDQRVTLAGLDQLAGGMTVTMPRERWEALAASSAELREHLAAGRVVAAALDERATRDHLGQSGHLDEPTWTVSLAEPREDDRSDMPIDAGAVRRDRPDGGESEGAASARETREYHKRVAKTEREARVSEQAEAVARALDGRKKSKKGPKQ